MKHLELVLSKYPSALRFALLFAALFTVISIATTFSAPEHLRAESPETIGQTLFTVPVGAEGILYEGVDVTELLPWGPSALVAAPDGTFWIADAVGARLRQYASDGALLQTVDTLGRMVGLTDLLITNEHLYVLDAAAAEPTIWQLDLQGNTLSTQKAAIGLADGLSGLAQDADGTLYLEQNGGATWFEQLEGDGGATTISFVTWPAAQLDRATLRVNSATVELFTEHQLVGVRVLKINRAGDFFVAVEELVSLPAVHVDLTVHHYAADGKRLGIARAPEAQQVVAVGSSVSVAPDNRVYVLLTQTDQVEVQELLFDSDLPNILPETVVDERQNPLFLPLIQKGAEQLQSAANSASVAACISREEMIAMAKRYLDNRVALSNANINNQCAARTKPRYLGSAATYSSVSYDWGGWDTIEGFNQRMADGEQAGDISSRDGGSNGVGSCSRGVDCSGFVTRVWGRTDKKYGTATLSEISTQLASTDQLLPGDIMNKSRSHVRVFEKFASQNGQNGGMFYESTTSSSLDRVVYRFLPWSSFSGYVPRRYDNVCTDSDPKPTPRPTDPPITNAPYNRAWFTDNDLTGETNTPVRDIRHFLSQKGSCLANPIQDVDGVEIDVPTLIHDAAATYKINPKVILATIEKEQGAISNCPSRRALIKLMGYELASVDTARAQIDRGTRQLRRYHDDLNNGKATIGGWQDGVAKLTTDGIRVTPATKAIAGQFTYTPLVGKGWGGNTSFGGVYLFWDIWYNKYMFDQPLPAPGGNGPTPTPVTPTATPKPSVDTCWPLHSTSTNSSGPNVFALQYLLRSKGHSLDVDGVFGPNTRAKVIRAQTANGLDQDGIVGPDTWQQGLIALLSQARYSRGDDVRALQYLLKQKFGYTIDVDGEFGPNTHNAVVSFQQAGGLLVDGIVGPQSWSALLCLKDAPPSATATPTNTPRPAQPTATPTATPTNKPNPTATETSTATPKPVADCWPLHSTTTNSRGPNVFAIQYLLREQGQSVSADGIFGPDTKQKVINVQAANGLAQDGIVGPNTWQQALIKTVDQGNTGDTVRAVQYLLKNKFGYSLDIDGIFGPDTNNQVFAFQQANNLQVDGIVGPKTWSALVCRP